MKLVRFCVGDGPGMRGVVEGESVVRVDGHFLGEWRQTDERHGLADVRLLAPIEPPNILALARSYKAHADESDSPQPTSPMLFSKLTTCLNDPGAAIRIPCASNEVDYEAELVVILQETVRNVTPERALDCVLGYTCGHDVSARDCQRQDGQFVRSKSFDTFGPMGPWIETELDPSDLAIQLRLNGEVMQDSRTSELAFSVPEIISFLSRDTTLLAGTAIFTGTPHGVGFVRTPPVFLQPGDHVEVEIEGIGVLGNPVVAG